jgi:hypothetical protein
MPSHAATVINLVDVGGNVAGTQAELGFKIAASFWERTLTNDANLIFNTSFAVLPDRVIGGASSNTRSVLVQDIKARLVATGTSELDRMASGHIALVDGKDGVKAINAITNGYINPNSRSGISAKSTRFDNDGTINNEVLNVNTANLKALGLPTLFSSNTSDATIEFSSALSFDFNPTDGISEGSLDFIGVAIHEMGHALGFVSGVDFYDFFSDASPVAEFTTDLQVDKEAIATPLDLFRYSAPGQLDWSVRTASYFSIDGGDSQVFGRSLMSTGQFAGDGRQASHWKDSAACTNDYGILDPTFCFRQMGVVTSLDLAGMDAIGWNIGFDVLNSPNYRYSTSDLYKAFFASAVPESATWIQMIIGFGVIGGVMRRNVRRYRLAPAHL